MDDATLAITMYIIGDTYNDKMLQQDAAHLFCESVSLNINHILNP